MEEKIKERQKGPRTGKLPGMYKYKITDKEGNILDKFRNAWVATLVLRRLVKDDEKYLSLDRGLKIEEL